MPKILLATPNEFYYSETFVRDHIAGLHPSVVLFGGWKPFKNNEGVNIFRRPFNYNLIRAGIKRLIPKYYASLYDRSLANYLKNEKIEFVLTEYGVTAANMLEACKKSKIPLTCIFHGFDAYEYATIEEYEKPYLSLFDYCNQIICVSNDMKAELASLGCDQNKIHVIPCGVDIHKFERETTYKPGNRLLFVGRFTPKKDPLGLIKSFETVLKNYPEATLSMVGEGELWAQCKDYIVSRQLNSIKLLGRKSPDEIKALYEASSIYVQHSVRVKSSGDSEGTPVSILEAAAMELPIVSTQHAGIKQAVVSNKTGYLSNEGDYNDFSAKICQLIANPELQTSFGREGRKHIVGNYNQKNLILEISKVIDLCL